MIVYTAQFGTSDPLLPPRVQDGTRFVCFTDQDIKSDTWEICPQSPYSLNVRGGRALARWHKINSHHLFPGETTLWVDGVFQLLVSAQELVPLATKHRESVVAIIHPKKNNLRDEISSILNLHLRHSDRVGNGGMSRSALDIHLWKQMLEYRKRGWPDEKKIITATGFLIRTCGTSVNIFNELWWHEVSRWPHLRDQMSVDFCAWLSRTRVVRLPIPYYSNEYARRHAHHDS